jgi:hypothetical protein
LFCGKSNSYNVSGEDCYWVTMGSPFIVSEYTLKIYKELDNLNPVSIKTEFISEDLNIRIVNNKVVLSSSKDFNFSIFCIDGKIIKNGDKNDNDVSFLGTGLYIVKLESNDRIKIEKFVKIN